MLKFVVVAMLEVGFVTKSKFLVVGHEGQENTTAVA